MHSIDKLIGIIGIIDEIVDFVEIDKRLKLNRNQYTLDYFI